MILLFGEKARRTNSARRSSNIKNHPVENSGILASRGKAMPSLLDANEYDMYMFSVQAHIDYAKYANDSFTDNAGYSNEYSIAMSAMSECASLGASFGGEAGGDFGGASFSAGGASVGGGSFGGGCSSCSGGGFVG